MTDPTAKPADAVEPPRRFYGTAVAGPAEGGFAVLLDGRVPRSPAGRRLIAPAPALAALLAAEWEGQGTHVLFASMPLTRLAFTALDRVSAVRAEVAAETARYAGSDVLCYFAEEPRALVERQAAAWTPILDWAASELGVRLTPATGIVHRTQPAESLERVRALAEAADDFSLAGLAHGAALFGSAVLALAVLKGRLSGAEAYELSRLDEVFQAERWGRDAEAEARSEGRRAEAERLEAWFRALV